MSNSLTSLGSMEPAAASAHVGPLPPPLPALRIRAPLSTDDVDTEPDTPSTDSSSDREESMPVAKLTTEDDEDDKFEERNDDVAPVVVLEPMQVKSVILVEDPKHELVEFDIAVDSDCNYVKMPVAKLTIDDNDKDDGLSTKPSSWEEGYGDFLDAEDEKSEEGEEGLEPMQVKPDSLDDDISAVSDDVSSNTNQEENGFLNKREVALEQMQVKSVIIVEDPKQETVELDAIKVEIGDLEISAINFHGGNAAEAIESLGGVSLSIDDLKMDENSIDTPDVIESDAVHDGETMALSEAEKDSASDEPARVVILKSSESVIQMLEKVEEGSSSARDSSYSIDEEVDTNDKEEGTEISDSAASDALCRSFRNGSAANMGLSLFSLRPSAPRKTQRTLSNPSEFAIASESESADFVDEEERKFHDQVDSIRVKFLRLVLRLGYSPKDRVAGPTLHYLGRAETIKLGVRNHTRSFSFESASEKAIEQEKKVKGESDFSCNILVIGKGGVGKTATINSIFGEEKSPTDPFRSGTTSVEEIVGIVHGIKIRVLDTPGLKTSVMDQGWNNRILSTIRKYMKRCPPDVILYVDRVDTQSGDFNDLPLLRSINTTLGSSIWSKVIVALTHASSAPPEDINGCQLSYDFSVGQRSNLVRQAVNEAAGVTVNSVALVENHPLCRRNKQGQRVLPDGCRWIPHLLVMCYSLKVISEAKSLLKFQNSTFGDISRFLSPPPMNFFLSSLRKWKAHPKLSHEQVHGIGDVDKEDEYDQLPPFRHLKKSQIAKLPKGQKIAYFDEYDYRVKLLRKKQLQGMIRELKEIRRGDVACEAYLGAKLRDTENPIGDDVVILGLSLMSYRSALAAGVNLLTQQSVGRNSKMAVNVRLNNTLSGNLRVSITESEQFPVAKLSGLILLARFLVRTICS